MTARADAAWKAAGLDRITLHACRHTFASLMIAAGVKAKALQSYMGHSSIRVTFDLYGQCPVTRSRPPNCSTATWQRAAEEAARAGDAGKVLV